MMDQFITSVSTHHVQTVFALVFLLFIFVCLFFLASLKKPVHPDTRAHQQRKRRFDAAVKELDQHHGNLAYRRSTRRPFDKEKRRVP